MSLINLVKQTSSNKEIQEAQKVSWRFLSPLNSKPKWTDP